ncbi:MAG: helix-turn-helix domain-containing protein [Chlorobiaceae bacterium]|nr:helix-turn-helix domain-containing protein [Chlorobiaceae bacterium]NTV59745.1 helix-turn-helix domain-containing protein [Chlorobiaceae bacterium]
MIFPCEKAVWYYLPQIRADMAIELVKSGMTQSQAAKKLGVTPAAISQYIHKKRGILSPKSRPYRQEIKEAVKTLCGEDAKPEELRKLVCSCCHLLQKEADDLVCG